MQQQSIIIAFSLSGLGTEKYGKWKECCCPLLEFASEWCFAWDDGVPESCWSLHFAEKYLITYRGPTCKSFPQKTSNIPSTIAQKPPTPQTTPSKKTRKRLTKTLPRPKKELQKTCQTTYILPRGLQRHLVQPLSRWHRHHPLAHRRQRGPWTWSHHRLPLPGCGPRLRAAWQTSRLLGGKKVISRRNR